ncbi:MAG: carbon-nitrogen hydrolase family protein [Saprospiraceae bacterium]|nr:carbon-nitrogen hydrolase family protein [Saprospiraceae bacterium]
MKDLMICVTWIAWLLLAMPGAYSHPENKNMYRSLVLDDNTPVNPLLVARSIRVAGLQMNVTSDIQTNKLTILEGISKAAEADADFLMTPEGSLSGYNNTFDAQELKVAMQEVKEAAKKVKVGLLLGTCYKEGVGEYEKCWNQIRVYSPEGNLLIAYSKILRCSPIAAPGTGEMLAYEEGKLETFSWNGIQFGTLICNDLWATPGYTTMANPYLPLKLKEMGAEVIFHAINSGKNQRYKAFHESSAELWAQSLGVLIMEVNAAQGTDPTNAQSGLIAADGERTVKVSEIGSQFFIADIELDKTRSVPEK